MGTAQSLLESIRHGIVTLDFTCHPIDVYDAIELALEQMLSESATCSVHILAQSDRRRGLRVRPTLLVAQPVIAASIAYLPDVGSRSAFDSGHPAPRNALQHVLSSEG